MHAVRWYGEIQLSRWQKRLRTVSYLVLLIGLIIMAFNDLDTLWMGILTAGLSIEYYYECYRRKKECWPKLLLFYQDGRCFWRQDEWRCYQSPWLNHYLVVLYLQYTYPPYQREKVILYCDCLPTGLWRDLRQFLLFEYPVS